MEVAEIVELPLPWSCLFFEDIKYHVHFYTSFCLISTSFFVIHGKTISLFDVVNNKWLPHFNPAHEILKVFRNKKSNKSYNLGIYLSNGKVNVIDSPDYTDPY